MHRSQKYHELEGDQLLLWGGDGKLPKAAIFMYYPLYSDILNTVYTLRCLVQAGEVLYMLV